MKTIAQKLVELAKSILFKRELVESASVSRGLISPNNDRVLRLGDDGGLSDEAGLAAGAGVEVRRPGSVSRFFVEELDTDAARGAALQLAKAWATSGDTVFVMGPGNYDTRDWLKDGVNWHWGVGTTNIYTGGVNGAVIDNTPTGVTGAVTCRITGNGVFKHAGSHVNGTFVSTVAIVNASSSIQIQADQILHSPASSSNQSSAFRHHGGTVLLDCPIITSTVGQGIWWSDGELFFTVEDVNSPTTPIYASDSAGPYTGSYVSGYFWGKCKRAKSSAAGAMQLAGAATSRAWVEIDEAYGNSASACVLIGVANNYAIIKKVNQAGAGAGMQLLSGNNWIAAQKIVTGTGTDGAAVLINGGTNFIDVLHLEPVAGPTAIVKCTAGTTSMRVLGPTTSLAAAQNGLEITGGTLDWKDGMIDATLATAANPVLKSGGTLTLSNTRLVAQAARSPISAPTAQNVTSYGSGGSGAAMDADVTLIGNWNGAPVEQYSVYAAGTAYALTATPAALDFGTTDPGIVLTVPGRYRIRGRVNLKYNGATFAAGRTVTLKFRRTNNTAADLTNGSTGVVTGIVTTVTESFMIVELPEISYSTTASDDAITIFGDVSVVPSAGSLDCVEANLFAERCG